MAKELQLALLGRLRITRGGTPVKGFVSSKAQALLCYLAVTGRSHFRDALAGLLWGNMPEANAKANLRVVLSNLRRLVGPHLIITRETAAFNRESPYWLDVEVLSQRVNEAMRQRVNESMSQRVNEAPRQQGYSLTYQPVAPLTHERVASLTEAVRLYRGDFLEGFYVHDAPAFEDWVLGRQERLRQLALQALHALAAHHTARGVYAAAMDYSTRLLALEPWQEEAHRQLMLLLALTGRRSAALAQYEECRRLLAQELDVEPMEETTALYERIRAEEISSHLPISPSPHLPISPAPVLPFVGREEEHAQLVAAWEQARGSQGKLTLIEGEAGSGKTRLVEEVLRYAETQGATVLRGRCYEFGATVAYQPIAEALRARIRNEKLEIRKENLERGKRKDAAPLISNFSFLISPVWLAEVARLLPELRERVPDLPPPVEVSGEAARQRLFEAAARLLQALVSGQRSAVGGRRSAVLFLDDLHWIDQATVDLLHYLIRRLADAPIWFLGAYRREEMDMDHPLLLMRRALSRDGRVALIRLGPLEARDITCGAHGLPGLDEAEAARLGQYLARESEGNPFILTELLHDLADRGYLHRPAVGDGWRLAPDWSGSATNPGVPFAVREVVLGRVARLPARSRDLLRLAAVIGREFDLPLLTMAAGDDAQVVDESMGAWLARRLVQMERGKGRGKGRVAPPSILHPPSSRYDFAHDKIRAVVYHAVAAGQRRMLHRRVGEALETLHAGRLEPVYEQLAHHYEQAGAVDKAVVYLPLAAAKAAALYANQEALDYYERALVLLADEDERRWEMLLRQAEILRLVGEYETAIAACQQVVEGGGDPWQARAANELSGVYHARRDYDQARTWALEAYRLAEAAGEETENCSGRSLHCSGRSLTEPEGARSGDRPQQLSARERARAKQVLGEVEREQGNLDLAQGLLEEALALHRALADQRGMAKCLNSLGRVFSARGLYDAARQRFQEALAVFQALGDRQSEAACLRTIGVTHWRQGANDAAHQAFAESLDICRAIGDRQGEAGCLNNLGLVYIVQKAYDETRRCWEESVALFRSLGLEKRAAVGLHNLGILHISQGAYAAAQQCLEESLAIDRAIGAKSAQALDLGWLGNLHFSRGDYDEARRCLEMALDLDREVGGSEEETWHLVLKGAVACETGDLAGAKAYFQEAIKSAEARDKSVYLSGAYHGLAEVHLAQGDGEAALAAAQQALADAEAGAEYAIGVSCAMLGAVYGSGLIEDAEDPVPHFERALALLRDDNPFNYGVALRRYGDYLARCGDPSTEPVLSLSKGSGHRLEQGQAHLREARAIFERLGAQGELDKVTRLLAGDDSPRLRW